MQSTPQDPQRPAAPDAARVADALARIRTGVRQRRAWSATRSDDSVNGPLALAQVQAAQRIEQLIPTSHRGVLGIPIVFAKKVVYRLFMQWYLRSLVQQQNAFNRSVTIALQDLYERQRTLTEALIESPAADDSRSAALPR